MTVKFLLDGYDAVVHTSDLPPAIAAHPSLRRFDFHGQVFARLPYNTRAVQAYRMAGLNLPAPILSRYDWPKVQGIHPARDDQKDTAQFAVMNPYSFILNEIGTGKTYSALWAADYLMREGLVRKCLIISPLSTLRRVWFDSVYSTFRGRTCGVLHGDAKKRKAILAQEHDFYVVNPAGLPVICKKTYNKEGVLESVTMDRNDFDMVIIDEIGMYRNAQTLQWAVLNKAIELIRPQFLWGMTGTPIPKTPADAWAQVKLVRPDRVPKYYTVFKRTVMQQVSEFKWVALNDAAEKIYAVMQPAIRYTRDEVIDLPPVVYIERESELSDQQTKMLKELQKNLQVRLKSGEKISVINEGALRNKFLQICSGVVYADDGSHIELDAQPRLEALLEVVETSPSKTIVFVPFHGALNLVAKFLRSHKYTVEVVHGGTPAKQRDEVFGRFQGTPEPEVLVADAGCMSHGLTLTEAALIVWYGPEDSNDTMTQANGRITRQGQKHIGTFCSLSSTKFEREVFKRVKEQGRLQDAFLTMVAEGDAL